MATGVSTLTYLALFLGAKVANLKDHASEEERKSLSFPCLILIFRVEGDGRDVGLGDRIHAYRGHRR